MDRQRSRWTAPDGVELGQTTWRPRGEPNAHLALIHGYAEHGGRYERFATAAVERGFAVHALDLRGHGTSPGLRGDLGSVERTVSDVVAYVTQLPSPRFLFGHSAGGAAATRAAADLRDVHGVVLSAPYLRNAGPVPAWLRAVAKGLAAVAPRMPVRTLDADTLSRIPEEVTAYRDDPLVYTGPVRAKTGTLLLEMGERALETAPRIGHPVLLMHGGDDQVADPEASRELAERIGHHDVHLEIVPGGYHELLNDLERAQVTSSILAWLEDRR